MNKCDPDKHLCPPMLSLFISVLGELNYLGQTSRPDILYALYSCYEHNKTQCQWGSVELALHRGQIHLHMPGIANRLDNAPNRNPINKTKVFWWDGFLSRTVGKSSNSVWWEATSVVVLCIHPPESVFHVSFHHLTVAGFLILGGENCCVVKLVSSEHDTRHE